LVKERLGDEEKCIKFIMEYLYCKKNIAEVVYNYVRDQDKFSIVPDENTLVVEKFRDEKEYLFDLLKKNRKKGRM
jgi:Lhr-like helicase